MMTAAESLLSELTAAGVTVSAESGGRLIVRPASKLTDTHRAAIRDHKLELLTLLAGWDQGAADALIATTLERVSQLYDELAPGSPVDTPEWDRVEALVSAAYELKTLTGLCDALSGYEEHARRAFTAWRSQAA